MAGCRFIGSPFLFSPSHLSYSKIIRLCMSMGTRVNALSPACANYDARSIVIPRGIIYL